MNRVRCERSMSIDVPRRMPKTFTVRAVFSDKPAILDRGGAAAWREFGRSAAGQAFRAFRALEDKLPVLILADQVFLDRGPSILRRERHGNR